MDDNIYTYEKIYFLCMVFFIEKNWFKADSRKEETQRVIFGIHSHEGSGGCQYNILGKLASTVATNVHIEKRSISASSNAEPI
jgi:hypothetical protein